MRNKFNLHLHAGEERVGTTLCWGRGRRDGGMGEGEGRVEELHYKSNPEYSVARCCSSKEEHVVSSFGEK